MNKQQKIFNILAKAQEPRKVELSLVEDVARLVGVTAGDASMSLQRLRRAKELADKIFSLKDDLIPLIKEAESLPAQSHIAQVEGFLAETNLIKSKMNQVEKLGIDPSSIKYYDQLIKTANAIESAFKEVKDIDKELKREINR